MTDARGGRLGYGQDVKSDTDLQHGNCGDDYKVLIGGRTYHKDRLGDYGWYRQCVQSAQAWWIMVVLT
jgi:hypothetical protein